MEDIANNNCLKQIENRLIGAFINFGTNFLKKTTKSFNEPKINQ